MRIRDMENHPLVMSNRVECFFFSYTKPTSFFDKNSVFCVCNLDDSKQSTQFVGRILCSYAPIVCVQNSKMHHQKKGNTRLIIKISNKRKRFEKSGTLL